MKLAGRSVAALEQARAEAFAGAITLETENTMYLFEDGVFSGRAPRPVPGASPAWQSPAAMSGVRLVGFLARDSGLWSLSLGHCPGSMAVMTTKGRALTLTSPTHACSIERATPLRRAPRPSLRRLLPPSMTRIQSAPAFGRTP